MYDKTARFYDAVYGQKNYVNEVKTLKYFIATRQQKDYETLLDVACGTGGHLQYLAQDFKVEGLDLDPDMLAVAKQRCPDVPLHQRNMIDFDLNRQFDVVTCLFSSIGYAYKEDMMRQAVATMARHTAPGGLLIIEPWFDEDFLDPQRMGMRVVDEDDLKICRMSYIRVENGISDTYFEYLIQYHDDTGLPQVDHFKEKHVLGLFSHDTYLAAFRDAGLTVYYDPDGIADRGLYIGVKNRTNGQNR